MVVNIPIVTLDKIYISPDDNNIYFLDCTRVNGSNELIARNSESVEEQIENISKNLTSKKIILADDVMFMQEYMEKEMETRELTDSEKKELAKLKGRYYGAFTKGAIESTKKEIKKISEEFGSVVEGFIEGIKSTFSSLRASACFLYLFKVISLAVTK